MQNCRLQDIAINMYIVKNNLAPTDEAELYLNNSRYSLRNKDFHLPTRFNTVTYGSYGHFVTLDLYYGRETKQQGQAITQLSVFQERYQRFRYFWYFFKFYFILLTSTKNQTNRKNVGRDTATTVANYSAPGY